MIKKIWLCTLILLSLISVQAQDKYKVTADKLNVRASSDPKSKIIGYVPQDEIVVVINKSNPKFYKIKVRNGEGWVSKDYLVLAQVANKSTTTEPKNGDQISSETAPTPNSSNSLIADSSQVKKQAQQNSINHKISHQSNTNQWIFVGLVLIIMSILVFLIFKYINSKFYKSLSLLIIAFFSYSIYQGFLVEKTVSGKYLSLANHQFAYFDFKPNGEVLVYDQLIDTTYISTYKIEGSKVFFKQDENLFIMIIKDENTLLGDGFLKGQYIK